MNREIDRTLSQVKLAYLVNLYPLLSETFIVSEVKNLEQAGLNVQVFSLFKPKPNQNELADAALKEQTLYWTPYLRLSKLLPAHFFFLTRHPLAYLKTLSYAFRHRNRSASFVSLIRGSMNGVEQRRQMSHSDRQNILLHFFLVMPFAAMILREGYTWVHAAFANIPSSFALLTLRLTGVAYSVSAHAMDIFIRPELLEEKFNHARFVVTCNRYNKTYLLENYSGIQGEKIHPIYHGSDLDHFNTIAPNEQVEPPVLLSVGRLVKKKGLGVLLQTALILMEKKVPFQIWIVGEGPERSWLELFCRINHLHERVKFWGAIPPDQVKKFYQQATLFVLPCVQDENGDRDGIPNVIAEAMAMRLPVVSSRLSAIPELVEDQVTGRLIPPNDPRELAAVLQELLEQPDKAAQMGARGRIRVEEVFDARKTMQELIALFKSHLSDANMNSAGNDLSDR